LRPSQPSRSWRRARPSDGSDADEFKPFSGNNSFDSGHTTEAFAVATVFAARAFF